MFNKKIIDFFKKHNLYDEEMFTYISKNCDEVDYYDQDINFMIGCPPRVNKKTNRIEGFLLTIPYCYDEITTLVAVHEIAHAIYWYKNLGKKYNKLSEELFPMIAERLYYEENMTPVLQSYESFLDSTIDETSRDSYKFALANRGSLMEHDISDFKSMDRITRKLSRKWRRQNR